MLQINNLSSRIATNQTKIEGAINGVLASGWLVLGPEVNRFEQAFAAYLGAGHCVSLANGTDAIELALKAMGIRPGERVATVANAGMYTTTALLAIGAKPWFMDVDIYTRGVTLVEVARAIEKGVSAVVVTHLYGLAIPEIAEISKYCKQKGVPLLEDCAQAHGAFASGNRVGTFGDAASFSFYPTKNLGALGDGGAVVTSDPALAKRVKSLRQYGWTSKYNVEVAGARNSRLDEIQAAVLSVFLPDLDAVNTKRRKIAEQYALLIRHTDIALPQYTPSEYVAHLYVVCTPRRAALRKHLLAAGISSDVHYPIPDYRQPLFGTRFLDVHLPNTERLAQEVLTLPCYPEMTPGEVSSVINAVNAWPSGPAGADY
jgi:dTDP-3-amino-2,3,6-trideoxy-4-keto-D-glucose/dTDP-3-amino-3,4,6-trideoxy-alpha-D-glucose/dTDP-2,6-dideoxy-D-kanosamine transaminase